MAYAEIVKMYEGEKLVYYINGVKNRYNAASIKVRKGELFKVVTGGGQVSDLLLFTLENLSEYFDQGLTRDQLVETRQNSWLNFTLISNYGRPLAEIIDYTYEYHDLLLPGCRREMYRNVYGINRLGCRDGFSHVLKIPRHAIPKPFNLFMKTSPLSRRLLQNRDRAQYCERRRLRRV